MALGISDVPTLNEGQGAPLTGIRPAYWNRLRQLVSNTISTLTSHVANTANPHTVTKTQVGLGNADNTADLNKPVALSPLTSGEDTIPRHLVTASTLTIGTGTLRLTYFTAKKAQTVAQVKMCTGTTAAAATPTLVRIGIYTEAGNGDLTLVASTANDTTLFAAASTAYTKALQASLATTVGTRYAVGVIVVTAAAAPTGTGMGNGLPAAELGVAPRICAGLGGQTDLPASIAAGTLVNQNQVFYAALLP